MQEAKLRLVDGRAQVKAALEGAVCDVPFGVRRRFAPHTAGEAVVTYSEYSNVSTQCAVVDALVYQVDVWAQDFAALYQISAAVNAAMVGMGLKRVWSSEDAMEEDGSGYLRKSYRFGRNVDKRTMRLVD